MLHAAVAYGHLTMVDLLLHWDSGQYEFENGVKLVYERERFLHDSELSAKAS